jgi:predicted DNA-binding protein YlxM (UPF0122 family)
MAAPYKITEEVVRLLEEAFSVDAPVTEACKYAGIARTSYYDYIKAHPEIKDRFARLKMMPRYKMRSVLTKAAMKDPKLALDYLKHKSDDFRTKSDQAIEVSGGAVVDSIAKLTGIVKDEIEKVKKE